MGLVTRGVLLGGVCWLAGCATTAGSSPGGSANFTSAAELKKLASGPRPERVFTTKTADLAQWDLVGPFPEEVSLAAHERESAAGQMIVGEASKRGAVPTAALACAARELAHFIVQKRERPPSLLQDTIAGRCGLGLTQLSSTWLEGEVADTTTDDALVAQMVPKLADALGRLGPATFVGAALMREGGRAVLSLTQSTVRGTLEPVSIFPSADGAVTLHGTAEAGTAELLGIITTGDVGATQCTDLHLRALPQYDLRCAAAATVETRSLDEVPWPAELINAEQLELLMVVSSTRQARDPWAHFVVMFARPEAQ